MQRIAMLVALGGALCLAWVASSGTSFGQSTEWDPVEVARAHLARASAGNGILPAAATDLAVRDVRRSPGAVHVQMVQTINGIPVHGSASTVSMKQGDVAPRLAIDNQVAVGAPVPAPQPALTQQQGEAAAMRAVSRGLQLRGDVSSSLVYFPLGLEMRLAWEVNVPARQPLGDWLVVIDAENGDLLGLNDLLAYDSGSVFSPNPFVQSGGAVPPPNDCDSAVNASTLTFFRQTVTLEGIAPAQNQLKGEYVDLTAPGIFGAYKASGLANEASRTYSYACNDDRFEEVMAYYHVDAKQRHIQSLGFIGESSILNGPIPVHAHYYDLCNAFYSPFDTGLHMGDGNVTCPSDAGEDAYIIIHEYGHAIHADSIPGYGRHSNPFLVEQARAIGEGFSDYVAAATFGDPCIGGWGLLAGVCIRNADNTNAYPADFEACPDKQDGTESEHCGGLIWSGALWDIAEALGGDDEARELVLRLALAANFYLTPTNTFAENAAAVVQADNDLYGGDHVPQIEAVFAARGISPSATPTDPAYYFLRVRHTFVGDLQVTVKVGANLAAPLCSEVIWNFGGGAADDIMGYIPVSESACGGFFPPSPAVPWHLEALDQTTLDSGYIADFEVAMPNSSVRCVSPDTPLAIPDGTSVPVAATIDCTVQEFGQVFDMDGDGCSNIAELDANPILGGDRDPQDFWDFFDVTGDSAIDFQDTLVILELFGTGPADGGYDPLMDRFAPDGSKPYRTAAASDGIDFNDVLLNLASFGHSCVA